MDNSATVQYSALVSGLTKQVMVKLFVRPDGDGGAVGDGEGYKHQKSCFDADLFKARGMVRNIDPNNDLTFIRIRSKKNEILIAPGEALSTSSFLPQSF